MNYLWEIRGSIEVPGNYPPVVRDATIWVSEHSKKRPGKVIRTSEEASCCLGFKARFTGPGTSRLSLYRGKKKYVIDVESAVRVPSAEPEPADPP